MTKSEKLCKGCNATKSLSEFVTVYGHLNPRGKYCLACFKDHQRQHAVELMDGRDYCLYCGQKVVRYCDYDERGKAIAHYLEMDHMDPLAKGGSDPWTCDENGDFELDESERKNTVYVCTECNQRKRDKSFVDWLNELEPKYRSLAREVYITKNGRTPEERLDQPN